MGVGAAVARRGAEGWGVWEVGADFRAADGESHDASATWRGPTPATEPPGGGRRRAASTPRPAARPGRGWWPAASRPRRLVSLGGAPDRARSGDRRRDPRRRRGGPVGPDAHRASRRAPGDGRGRLEAGRLRNDGTDASVDFEQWLSGPVFEPLQRVTYLRKFFIDGGTVVWPNGADVAPETLYEAAQAAKSHAELQPTGVNSARRRG